MSAFQKLMNHLRRTNEKGFVMDPESDGVFVVMPLEMYESMNVQPNPSTPVSTHDHEIVRRRDTLQTVSSTSDATTNDVTQSSVSSKRVQPQPIIHPPTSKPATPIQPSQPTTSTVRPPQPSTPSTQPPPTFSRKKIVPFAIPPASNEKVDVKSVPKPVVRPEAITSLWDVMKKANDPAETWDVELLSTQEREVVVQAFEQVKQVSSTPVAEVRDEPLSFAMDDGPRPVPVKQESVLDEEVFFLNTMEE